MDLIDQIRLAVFEDAMLFELSAGWIGDPGGLNVVQVPGHPITVRPFRRAGSTSGG